MSKILKKILINIFILSLVLSIFSCSNSRGKNSSFSNGIIKIGVFEPQTGESSSSGMNELYGIRYANKIYNMITVGDKEYKLELVEVDNKSDKQDAVSAAQKLIAEKVDIVIGSYDSNMSISVGESFKNAKIPAISCSNTNPQVTNGNEYYFRICYMDPFEATVLASYAKKQGCSRVAILTEKDNEYSEDLTKFFIKACEKYNIEIVSNEKFEAKDENFSAIFANIKSANPQAIFVPVSITYAPSILSAINELDIESQIIASNTWENKILLDAAKDFKNVIALTTFYNTGASGQEEYTFLNGKDSISGFPTYLSSLGLSSEIYAVSALGYDAYLTAYKVIEAMLNHNETKNYHGQLKSEDIITMLRTITFNGVTGNISFDTNGDLKRNVSYIKEVENGKFKLQETIKVD